MPVTRIATTAFGAATAPARLALRVVTGLFGGAPTAEAQGEAPEQRPPGERESRSRAGKAGAGTRRRRPVPDPQRRRTPKDLDDTALARKVETVIFRDPEVDKGKIDVNAAGGVVWLRGEARTPDLVRELERRAQEVPEVRQVENLLHLPKTPAPSRTDTPAGQRRTRRSRPPLADRKE